MPKLNKDKKSCKDVFSAMMLSNADYVGNIEMPLIKPNSTEPTGLVPFSKINRCTDYNKWVHFYEYDYIIERIWKYPNKYLNLLKQYDGVITPDFSLYRDMPLMMQMNNIFRSRMVGRWLQDNGIDVIANIRYGDKRTYKFSCLGVSKHSSISIGTYGSMKENESRQILEDGLPIIINSIQPKSIIIYGTVSKMIEELCDTFGINLIVFKSEFEKKHLTVKEVN